MLVIARFHFGIGKAARMELLVEDGCVSRYSLQGWFGYWSLKTGASFFNTCGCFFIKRAEVFVCQSTCDYAFVEESGKAFVILNVSVLLPVTYYL